MSAVISLQTEVNVETSFFEIYNEKIHDLLTPSKGLSLKQNVSQLSFYFVFH